VTIRSPYLPLIGRLSPINCEPVLLTRPIEWREAESRWLMQAIPDFSPWLEWHPGDHYGNAFRRDRLVVAFDIHQRLAEYPNRFLGFGRKEGKIERPPAIMSTFCKLQ